MPATETSSTLPQAEAELQAFLQGRNSVVLCTQDPHGEVELSVAPYLLDDGAFVLFLSELAPHTRNLRHNPHARLLLLDDEGQTRQPFARQRVHLSCTAAFMERDTPMGQRLLERMEQRFGSIIPVLKGLPDFQLFRLEVESGRYIAGFGKAYRLEGLMVVEHLRS